jgi:chromosome segregation ATPase
MGRVDDLSKIDRSIKDAEIRIRTVQINLDALDKEIYKVLDLEKILRENVKCLKSQKIIAIAQEFKKAKEDLKKSQSRLLILKNDQERFKKALKDAETFIKQATKDYEKLQKSGENNVLNFKSRNKNGQG